MQHGVGRASTDKPDEQMQATSVIGITNPEVRVHSNDLRQQAHVSQQVSASSPIQLAIPGLHIVN
jgi:hypothetical protein